MYSQGCFAGGPLFFSLFSIGLIWLECIESKKMLVFCLFPHFIFFFSPNLRVPLGVMERHSGVEVGRESTTFIKSVFQARHRVSLAWLDVGLASARSSFVLAGFRRLPRDVAGWAACFRGDCKPASRRQDCTVQTNWSSLTFLTSVVQKQSWWCWSFKEEVSKHKTTNGCSTGGGIS